MNYRQGGVLDCLLRGASPQCEAGPPRLGKPDMPMDMPSLEGDLGPILGSASGHLQASPAVSGPDTSAAVHLRL